MTQRSNIFELPRWPRSAAITRRVELIVLFVALPFAVYFESRWIGRLDGLGISRLPKIPALLTVTLYCTLRLFADRSFDIGRLWNMRMVHAYGREIWRRFAWGAPLLLLLAFKLNPEGLFAFPRLRPDIWRTVMLLYPWLSAYPQEIVYRAYFFHRYGPMLGPAGVVLASAIAFALLHIVFGNIPAVALSLAGGYIFSLTYRDTGSLYAATLEHALYGCWVFTVGLGPWFYQGTQAAVKGDF